MDLKFIWEQAQLAKEKDFELEGIKSLLLKSEAEMQRLKEAEGDFKELLGCLAVWSDETGVYVHSEKTKHALIIKEKYNEQV